MAEICCLDSGLESGVKWLGIREKEVEIQCRELDILVKISN